MTERKRWDLTFETWIERQIRVAQDRGDFDDLPGYGKPIPDHGDDELWWVKSYLAREGLSTEALLPPELQLRREIERLPDTVGSAPSEKVVREIVSDLNRRIADCLRFPSGLPVPIHKVDTEEMVEVWRVERARRREAGRLSLGGLAALFRRARAVIA
ncbi:J-domain-containing protein, partial [Rhodococcus rhodochrous]|uniref:J-domain-containing protein n=1 Tax=Rhodococcus rhodochrous TaxID=1829 RepID=UPI003FD26AFE